ncbi:hypothetical protein DH2020_009620 [Rehmannia glutinosa]|uniref:ABC transporter domain-containing protein n=1 Tax=Rehmannia glutinosa TaxID=99300 RepID=A0ABR0X6T7_REHGL
MASVRIPSLSLSGTKPPPVERSSTIFSSPCRFSYRPPGTEIDLLNGVSFSLPEKSFGLIFGRSGSGKTTLLQVNLSIRRLWFNQAGLSKPTSGSIYIQRYGDDGYPNQSPELLQPGRVGIVFQFPERFFVADNVLDEIIFGWPRQRVGLQLRELLASRLHKAMTSVGLTGISLDKDPQSLSGGYKRRLALAIQLEGLLAAPGCDNQFLGTRFYGSNDLPLKFIRFSQVQTPDLLILDEPLAGLDWKARADVVKLLKDLKKELTLLVVSHDLKSIDDRIYLCLQRAGISRGPVLEDGNGWSIEE